MPPRRTATIAAASLLGAAAVAALVYADATNVRALGTDKRLLVIRTVTPGEGPIADSRDEAIITYHATLPDGTPIDELNDRPVAQAYRFNIDDNTVIAGVNDTVIGMQPGETRHVTIPPRLHFGEAGYADVIPPNTDIHMTITLLELNPR